MSDKSYRFISLKENELNIKKNPNAFIFLNDVIDTYLPTNIVSEVKAFLDYKNIKKLLKENPTISKDFNVGNNCLRITLMALDNDIKDVVCGFECLQGKDSCRESQDNAIRKFMDIMLKSEGKESSIDNLVKEVGKYYDADRSYIFEEDETGKYTVNTYEWCKKGVMPEKDNLQQVPIEITDPWIQEFYKKGSFYISCDDEYAKKEPIVYEVLEPQNIQSLMAAPLLRSKHIFGFLGVDNPSKHVDQELYLSVAASVLNHEILAKNERIKDDNYKKALKESSEAAQAANIAKTSFLFNMSHDIRTPINAIMGYRDLLEKHQDNPLKRKDYLVKIKEASTVLLSIINNVLEMARIEKGTVEIANTAINISDFINTIYAVFRELMHEKGIDFSTDINVEHQYIYCDETKFREIMFNLLSNAYKYTKVGGSVYSSIEEYPSKKKNETLLKITVADNGIGMSDDFQKHIFEEFSRENNTTEGKIEGTGLGMPIVKRLVEMLGGTISLQSKKDIGSLFTLIIPVRIANKQDIKLNQQAIIDKSLFKNKRILLAEDNEFNAEIAIELLNEEGFQVDRADDGKTCVEMIKNAKPNYYDVILMDIQMPNMNGYEATKEIRKLKDKDKANTKIIAMTANAFEEDKQYAIKIGMDGHLAKPIIMDELLMLLSNIFNNSH